MERFEWVLEPLISEIRSLEERELELKRRISDLENKPAPDELEPEQVTFNITKRVVVSAQNFLTDKEIKKVLGNKKLSKVPESDYPQIVKKLKRMIADATNKKKKE